MKIPTETSLFIFKIYLVLQNILISGLIHLSNTHRSAKGQDSTWERVNAFTLGWPKHYLIICVNASCLGTQKALNKEATVVKKR